MGLKLKKVKVENQNQCNINFKKKIFNKMTILMIKFSQCKIHQKDKIIFYNKKQVTGNSNILSF